ncbi:thiamine/thiamine pyrophosphate ABC transporter permease [Rhizobium lemnae]|uniref:Thiamine transport system permease protein ThiP n=1 Tax=Rhizobium lemnae TaxID=1214924 RepID=A0ABV8E6L1_9HYPH|nr:thiamine/thiamine pyrophosphate ABC transporter permease [Rhizobium lemnae]MCJ8506543.1 thiamine/thiamine pyrophosphate ABC transporter permease [Rhizobium lemnae]
MLTRSEQQRGLAGGVAALTVIALLVLVPVAVLLAFAPTGLVQGSVVDDYTLSLLRFTLSQAILSTALSLCLALPVALALARQTKFPGRIWLVRLMALPMGLPVLIGALGLIGIFGRQGLVNKALLALGLEQPISIYGLSGILIAHVFFNLPLATRMMLAALERLPQEYWRLTASLGMRRLSILRYVELPALMRVIPATGGLIFMLCATSFTLVLVLGGGPAATTLEVAIYQALRFDFDPPRAIALALMQMAVTTIILLCLNLLPKAKDTAVGEGRLWNRYDGRSRLARSSDAIIILLATAFLILPLAMILVSGLSADLVRLALEPDFRQALLTSLSIAFCAGASAVTIGFGIIGADHVLSARRTNSRSSRVLGSSLSAASSLVLLVPPVVLGTGWFLSLRPFGDVNLFAPAIIAAINMLMALPFVIRVIEPAIRAHAAQTDRLCAHLGLTGWARFRIVDWPILFRPALTALSFAMALSLGDLGAVALFSSQDLLTLPWLVYSSMGSYRTADADGYALLLGLVCLGFTILGTVGNRRQR